MRLVYDHRNQQFANFIQQVGEGKCPKVKIDDIDDYIEIPEQYCIKLDKNLLFDTVYDNFEQNYLEFDYMMQRMIVTPRIKHTNQINDIGYEKLRHEHRDLFSINYCQSEEHNVMYSPDFLNTIELSGLPPHHLKLKINQPIMLIRNLSIFQNLCNGTRLIVKSKYQFNYY